MVSEPKRRPPFPLPDRNFWRISGRPGPDDRPALASGHPVTWTLLTEGTVLDGAPYPHPVFET